MRVSIRCAVLILLVASGCGQNSGFPTSPSGRTSLSPAALSSNGSTVVSIPVGFTIQPSGKAAIQACVGEPVDFAGTAQLVAHETVLANGSVVFEQIHINPQGATAVGVLTGTTYRLVGGESNEIVTAPPDTLTATFAADLIAIGPGAAHNFVAHILQHITILADGTITALSDVFSVTCR
jgi:hypothetical protein